MLAAPLCANVCAWIGERRGCAQQIERMLNVPWQAPFLCAQRKLMGICVARLHPFEKGEDFARREAVTQIKLILVVAVVF